MLVYAYRLHGMPSGSQKSVRTVFMHWPLQNAFFTLFCPQLIVVFIEVILPLPEDGSPFHRRSSAVEDLLQ